MLAAIKAGTGYFAIVFAAGFLLGTLRVFALAPNIGEASAVLVEIPVILSIAWFASRWLITRSRHLDGIMQRLVMGAFAFCLLMFGEVGVSTLGFGRTLAEHFAHYRTASATIGLAGQVAFALFPVIQLFTRRA